MALRDLLASAKAKAARWLGLAAPVLHTAVVAGDRFDEMTWQELLETAAKVRELRDGLHERFDYVDDLLRDLFLAAFKVDLQLHGRTEMDPSRLVNHEIVTAITEAPDFAELRRYAVGDPYVAAMALLSLAGKLRELLERARDTQEAAEVAAAARQACEDARQQLQQAVADADTDDGQDQDGDEQGDEQGQGGQEQTQDGDEQPGTGDSTGDSGDAGQPAAASASAGGSPQAAAAGSGGPQGAAAGTGSGPQGAAAGAAGAAMVQAIEAATTQVDAADKDAEAAAARAEQALAAIAPGLRAALRTAAAEQAEAAEEEAELFRAWGLEPGQLQRMPFEERRRLAERLRSGRLAQFYQLIGRFRRMAEAERARKTEHGADELHDVELSDHLHRLTPGELVALGTPELEDDFVVRFSRKRLLTYKLRGEERVGRGAVIAAIDCSGSMGLPDAGGLTREAWAKACALALLDQARAAKRDFVGILFATASEVKVFHFPQGQGSIEDVLDFVEFFWNGAGTNFEVPLDRAVDILEADYNQAGTERGDVAFISDGECGVGDDWLARYQERKTRLAFRTFGMPIGPSPNPAFYAVSDLVCPITDLADVRTVRGVFQVV
jgi:uncharacterized protein with von Willebrand factor type A (vWA) domain